ncbi:hypothetical protein V9T40_014942 [Parthenolecanium corni]|uniref:Uncharacterized protein n=1 Tax=Parthenolecanium corni TaxID=536013 RepID=A0AAN9TP99_9HEMI
MWMRASTYQLRGATSLCAVYMRLHTSTSACLLQREYGRIPSTFPVVRVDTIYHIFIERMDGWMDGWMDRWMDRWLCDV